MRRKVGVLVLLLAVTSGSQQWHGCKHDQERQVSCRLRTLHPGTALEIQEQDDKLVEARKLALECSDLFHTDSELQSDHFGSLSQLEELQISACKIRRLPKLAFGGLTGLKSLTLNSYHHDDTNVILEADVHSLRNLGALQRLDLAHNNLLSLAPGTLCDLPSMKAVNVSHNQLLDVSDLSLSLSDGCLTTIEVLDLSHNRLGSLRAGELVQAPRLSVLDLSANRINLLGDLALRELSELRELDLSDNRLAALPPSLFSVEKPALERLHLQNNSLTLLPPKIFSGLSGLAVLNLSMNAIASDLISAQTFAGLENLLALDLSHNRLTRLDEDALSQLPALKILRLQHNGIKTLAPSALVLQSSLQMLSLSSNKLQELDESSFESLAELKSLSLDHNEIADLPDNIFENTIVLEDLTLDNNKLKKIPKSISSLGGLSTLDLGENDIKELTEGVFNNLPNLYGLRLSGNGLVTISSGHFGNASSLHVLNLARNQLRVIEQGAFNGMVELRALRLDNNKLTDINGIMTSLDKLQWLNVSSNELQWFDYAFVPHSVEWLDMHDNQIEELGNYYKLIRDFNLKTLDAGTNRIKALTKLSLPPSLEVIQLSGNQIAELDDRVFQDKHSLQKVDLTDNNIQDLRLEALYTGKTAQASRPEFFLSGNPLVCDCEMEWLQQINDIAVNGDHGSVADLDEVVCQLGDRIGNNGTEVIVPILEMRPESFLCQYQTHCFATCMCCEFYACDCRMHCPDGCDCFHDAAWASNVIECSARGHEEVPLLIPMDATEIRLDGNRLGNVDTQSFIGRRRVKSMYMNDSHLTSLSAQTLTGLVALDVLHLENNQLRELHGHEFSSLVSLRELYLQNNDLIRIHPSTFDALASLSVLRLEANLLTTFPAWQVASTNPFLVVLSLSENVWSCECEFLMPFTRFLASYRQRIVDVDSIVCVADQLVERRLDPTGRNITCEEDADSNGKNALKAEQDSSEQELQYIIVSCVLALVFVLAVFLIVCVFRANIKRWLYHKSSEVYESRSGSSMHSSTYGQQMANKLFDIYISYSIKDADFVDQNLAPTLEHGATSYKLCLHQRDFPPSASLYDTVSVATESSSRVLLVLSRSYLEAEWPHVKIPLRNALAAQRDGRSKLILIFLEELGDDILSTDPELRRHTKSCPSIRWGSGGFLNKLRFFLPEPAFLTFQRNVTLRTLQPSALLKEGTVNLTQVDQVSGVWTYTLQHPDATSSVATQSTNDAVVTDRRLLQHLQQRSPPSVISSLYSHHTYQSIPEHQQMPHIYHTLEPSLLMQHKPINAVYINRNLDLVMKTTEEEAEEEEEEGGGGGEGGGDTAEKDDEAKKKETSLSSSTSSASSKSSCHHKSQVSTLSAQQLLPSSESSNSSSSSSSSSSNDEYIV